MSDKIDFGGEPWQAIPRGVLRDERLSPRAKGGLVTLLSHEDGWVRSAIGILQRECRAGRAQAQAIMRELRDAGYAELVKERTLEGRIASHYIVRAVSQTTTSEAGTVEVPVAGVPTRRDSRPSGTQSAVVEALDVDPLDEEPRVTSPRKRDEIADALAFAEGSEISELSPTHARALVVKAHELRRIAPDVTSAEVARRAAHWPSHFDATMTGPAIVKHWGRLGRAGTRHGREMLLDRLGRELVEEVNDEGFPGSTGEVPDAPRALPRMAG